MTYTEFETSLDHLVERYMKRAVAYGCFPGFFSHNAAEGHYFTRPGLYERDRDLFRKYVPLCKLVAEAGWEPITAARSGERAHSYRAAFGDQGTRYLTIFNDSPEQRGHYDHTEHEDLGNQPRTGPRQREVSWTGVKATISLGPEDVAVLELMP